MGSKSKSKSSTTTTNNATEYNVSKADYSTGDGTRTDATVSGSGNNVTVNTSDYGAVQGGLALAGKSLDTGLNSLKAGFDFGALALDKVDTSSARTVSAVKELANAQERSNANTIDKVLAIQEQRTTDNSKQMVKLLIGLGLIGLAGVAVNAYLKGKK